MSKSKEKSLVEKALNAISKGNAVLMKKNIKEALLSKVRRAVDKKEKEIAKSLIEAATKTTIKEAKDFTVMATSDIPTKDDSKLVIRDGGTIRVSSKQELAKLLKTSVKDLFVDSDHEKLFDSLAAQGKMPHIYVDPYDQDINNTFSLGVAASRKEAEKQERDSAGDI